MSKLEQKYMNTNMSKRFKIFVGNLPEKASHSSILTYFMSFGHIEKLRLFFKDSNDKISRGYCHIFTDEKRTYSKILKCRSHYYQGRKITCSALISGKKLDKRNKVNNNKRLVVRNLPIGFTDDDLYKLFANFGDIEMAYIFKSHGSIKDNIEFTPTGSVQFVDDEVAIKLGKTHYVEIEYNETKTVLVVFPFIDKYSEIKDTIFDLDQEHRNQLESGIKKQWVKAGLVHAPEYIMKEELIYRIGRFEELKYIDKKANALNPKLPASVYHSLKPTSRLYFKNRYGSAEKTHRENFRYNSGYSGNRNRLPLQGNHDSVVATFVECHLRRECHHFDQAPQIIANCMRQDSLQISESSIGKYLIAPSQAINQNTRRQAIQDTHCLPVERVQEYFSCNRNLYSAISQFRDMRHIRDHRYRSAVW